MCQLFICELYVYTQKGIYFLFDIVIFVDFKQKHDFGWVFATWVRIRIRFIKQIRIRVAEMKRIRYTCNKEITSNWTDNGL